MTATGRIVEVSAVAFGDVVIADHAVGATTLAMNSVVDFDEEGGALSFVSPADDTTTVVQAYVSLDPDAETLQLASPLTVALPTDSFVSPHPPSDEKIALVLLDDQDDPLSARIPHSLYDRVPEGIRDPDAQEAVEVTLDSGGEWTVTDVLGAVPLVDGSYIDPTTLPEAGAPTDPPVAVVLSATGSDKLITLMVEGVVDPSTVLDYYVDGVLAESTRSSIVNISATPAGAALVAGVEYDFHVIPRNDVGSAAASNHVTATLDPRVTSEQIIASIRTGFVLAGVLEVGLIRVSSPTGVPGDTDYDPGGIVIPLSSGGEIRFPADGSDAVIDAIVRTRDIAISGGLSINGTSNYLNGKVFLGSGTANPTGNVAIGYRAVRTVRLGGRLASTFNAENMQRGLARLGDGSRWATIRNLPDNRNELVIRSAATGGTVVGVVALDSDDVDAYMLSVTAVGQNFYVLGQRWNPTTSRYEWRMHKHDADGNLLGGVFLLDGNGNRIAPVSLFADGAIAADPDGVRVWVAKTFANGRLRFYPYSVAPLSGTPVADNIIITADLDPYLNFIRGSMYVGNADFGTKHFVIGGMDMSGAYSTYVWDQLGAPMNNYEWGTDAARGLFWDGTRFVGLFADAQGAYLSDYNTNFDDATVYSRYAWYDNNPLGGNAESVAGDASSAIIPKRMWPSFAVPAPPKSGTGDQQADSVRIYTGSGSGTTKLLTTITSGRAETYVSTVLYGAGPDTPKAVSTFTAASATGSLEAASNGFWVDGVSAGSVGVGTFRDSVRAAATVDSGWTTLTLATGFTSAGQTPGVRVINGIVYFKGTIQRTGGYVASTNYTPIAIGAIPVAMRPVNRYQRQCAGSSGATLSRGIVNADGSIDIGIGTVVPTYVDISGLAGMPLDN